VLFRLLDALTHGLPEALVPEQVACQPSTLTR
jgi:hypothetical protein